MACGLSDHAYLTYFGKLTFLEDKITLFLKIDVLALKNFISSLIIVHGKSLNTPNPPSTSFLAVLHTAAINEKDFI